MSQIHELILERFETCFPEDLSGISVFSPREEPDPLLKSEKSDQENYKLYLIAGEDGRDTVAELTCAWAKKVYAGEVDMDDVSMQLIQKELEETIMPNPDLLIVFGGHIDLCGYPPWQSRSAELSCMRDNGRFRYQVFLNALKAYAGAEMRDTK
ncbi:hypothetical protein J3459_012479 [Metarhizium acridum]|nr:hypothetical protein J3459_012479 [Metarhizium acridum]